jgi:hypothetical protein
MEFSRLEVLDHPEIRLIGKGLDIANAAKPRGTHALKTLNQIGNGRITGGFGNDCVSHVIKGNPKVF